MGPGLCVNTLFGYLSGLPYLVWQLSGPGALFIFWKNHFFILYCGAARRSIGFAGSFRTLFCRCNCNLNFTPLLAPFVSSHNSHCITMERVKFTIEFLFKASPAIVYKFFTTPSCLVRWFCDEVDIQGDTYTFYWSGSAEEADLIEDIEEEKLRFHWHDSEDEEYLEFEISKSPVTGETILLITDFCDDDEVDDQKQLWHSQMEDLRKEMGG